MSYYLSLSAGSADRRDLKSGHPRGDELAEAWLPTASPAVEPPIDGTVRPSFLRVPALLLDPACFRNEGWPAGADNALLPPPSLPPRPAIRPPLPGLTCGGMPHSGSIRRGASAAPSSRVISTGTLPMCVSKMWARTKQTQRTLGSMTP